MVDWPAELEWKRISGTPAPVVTVSNLTKDLYSANFVRLGLEYRYGVQKIGATATQTLIPDLESHTLIERDFGREREALARFETLGLEFSPLRQGDHAPYRIIPSLLPDTVRTILSWGWPVEAEGKKVQPLQKIEITTESGIDWFELKGRTLLEEGNSIVLPALLAAIRNHGGMIALGDGAIGMVPEEWLSKFASFAALGTETEEGFRFTKNQGLLVSLWLLREETTPAFQGLLELKKSLGRLTELKPLDPPDRFHGTLRPYQKEGIGWLKVLEDTGMGGILADDMGLGKTVQLLAHLAAAARAQPAEHSPRPSLILLPKSLLHNWADEAARFTPDLRVLLHHGTSRSKSLAEFSDYDLILMTYATARIDFDRLREVPFRYLIADEAQAIKNPASQVSRVSKLLQARHRVALTGTPIENSIEDLLSIMDFANPGLLGRWKNGRNSGEMKGLAKAISPFILRRTKQQVLSDLPPKTELTLPCELSPKEKKNYAALRDHYRMSLKNEISSRGMARSKLKVLEALLRLRQAACHPGLIDQKMRSADSTKIDLLVEQLRLIGAEGHKALVFSQFTSFLDLVKSRLEREGITYEYLDGQTSDRSGRVKRFQEDPDTGVFLISLKAGGTGLNLTAADYVFLLDPWWNPAVESQAIDRAHRIGQKNKVMAYRLIAKDTIEEKIVQLQKQKRELADAIVNADHAALLRSLTPKDLDELLS
ncbi:MAG: DEAD/DEAH box helicase [Proteobacteria bacterium]|nr:DEAD/DEAH box helicase [Pseudomonadota bacterium]